MSTSGASLSGVEWLHDDGAERDVVLSSRVRLARNVSGFPFLHKATREDRCEILSLIKHTTTSANLAPQLVWIDLPKSPQRERDLLVERHLISRQHSKGERPRAVVISAPRERLSIMALEEDHLRIQVMRAGLALHDAYEQCDKVDDAIEDKLDFAFHNRFGYLTACPTNVGTGIRVSVMLHLPGLRMTGEIDKVRRAAKGMNLAVRGFYGEGSESVGDLYQISNQTTLGKSEEEILQDFEQDILPRMIEYERHARQSLLDRRMIMVEDRIQRALGTLRHARLLNADEALKLLSQVRMGVVMGLADCPERLINELMLLSQPAHLQQALGQDLDQAGRRESRATMMRERLG
ncbi:MAG: protein arginine kinase [Planctomycetota bacterium]|jgi:protein arginine kinase